MVSRPVGWLGFDFGAFLLQSLLLALKNLLVVLLVVLLAVLLALLLLMRQTLLWCPRLDSF
jgi:hypothetical protein